MIQGNDRLQIERHIFVCIIVNISSGISLTIPNLYFGEKNIFLYNNDHLSMIEYGNRVVLGYTRLSRYAKYNYNRFSFFYSLFTLFTLAYSLKSLTTFLK